MRYPLFIGILLIFLGRVPMARAELSLGSPFGDRMVVQRDSALTIWGWDQPGAKVEVTLAGKSGLATADADGAWKVVIFSPAAGGPYELIASGSSRVRCVDVLSGEVWLASGQSNMVMPLRDSLHLEDALTKADNANVRFFQVKRTSSDTPQKTVQGKWVSSSKESAVMFSGVAFYFAQKLQQELGVPVGIIESAWGGSSITAWLPPAVMKSEPQYARIQSIYNERASRYKEEISAWEKAGQVGPRPPSRGGEVQQGLSNLDNGMNNPLKPYSIRGVIWYQGEADAIRPDDYKRRFKALVASWRASWGQPKLPVYFAQLSGFDLPAGRQFWAAFREAQRELAQEIPDTDMAVTIDVGDPKDIHPKNKRDPGLRLAQIALAKTYARDMVPGGPLPVTATLAGNAIEIKFTRTGQGLRLDGAAPQITLLGRTGETVQSALRMKNATTLSAQLPDGFTPVSVRYAWEGFPTVAIYNKEGFPASPFSVWITP
jgi:sialate O-acetylesterase